MATAYAPYSNAMRLGQGFNSYTQNITIDSAVVFDPPKVVSNIPPPPPPVDEIQRQIVTYSSQFVDKLSDVVEATNLSPSTSIKSGSIGNSGKGGGGFIDCDKFKEADINYLIYVKAISQPSVPPTQENMRFQRIKGVTQDVFNRMFGDCFISGFLEGGEFTALVSITIPDEVKAEEKGGVAKIKATARLALATLTGREEADMAILAARKVLSEKTELTMNVNWSGGGRLKEEDTQWDIDSILRVAARFPDLVQKCPQRIAAVLSKYTTLRSFHEQCPNITPLEYDNVVLYHTYLLEAYMEYKYIVKQLNQMLEDTSAYEEVSDAKLDDLREELKPIQLILSELDDAKTYCRNQMLRIVKEVDNIAYHPELASSEDHIPPFMSSELFAALIPHRKIITPPLHQAPLNSYTFEEQRYLQANYLFGYHFIFSPRIGAELGPPMKSLLKELPEDQFPVQIDLYSAGKLPRGFVFHYPDPAVSLAIGNTAAAGNARSTSLVLGPDEKVVRVDAVSKRVWKEKIRLVVWVQFSTNLGRSVSAGQEDYDGIDPVSVIWGGAGVKGCYGMFGDAVDSWGVIWARK